MGDSDIEDMEEEPSQPLDSMYEELNSARLLDLDPEAAAAVLAICRAYHSDLPAEQRAQYCQMQLSMETDGGSHAVKRVLIHQENCFVGHRMTNGRFTEVAFEDRIKLEGEQNLPLPKRPDSRQKKEPMEKKETERLSTSSYAKGTAGCQNTGRGLSQSKAINCIGASCGYSRCAEQVGDPKTSDQHLNKGSR